MGKVRILKDVSFLSTPGREERSEQWTMGLWLTVCPIADDYGHRRRDQGILRPSREDERLIRQHETAPAKHHEPHAPDGREDGRRLEGLARLLRRRGPDLHVRLAVLVKSLARRSSSLSYFKVTPAFLSLCLGARGVSFCMDRRTCYFSPKALRVLAFWWAMARGVFLLIWLLPPFSDVEKRVVFSLFVRHSNCIGMKGRRSGLLIGHCNIHHRTVEFNSTTMLSML